MIKIARLAASTALIAMTAAPSANAAALDAYLWKSRPVVLFAPSRDAPQAIDQMKRLTAARTSLSERDMPVFVVTRDGVTALSGGKAAATLDAAALRRDYRIGDEAFAIVLVGKDGGEKLRSTDPVDADRLTALVDTMPMRARETPR